MISLQSTDPLANHERNRPSPSLHRCTYLLTINGHKLEQPVGIRMYGVVLSENDRCVFKGYDTGHWIGVPKEVLRATGMPAPQAVWQFHSGFSPTSIERPKDLKIE